MSDPESPQRPPGPQRRVAGKPPAAGPSDPGLTADPLATEPRHTHAATPLVTALGVVPAVVLAMLALGLDPDSSGIFAALPFSGIGATAALVLLVALLTVFFTWLSWRRMTFWFDDSGDLRVASGVLTHNERRLQLSRLQSVDVAQPLLARVVRMAVLKVEVAGGGDSRVVLQYLTESDANRLRDEVLARAAGLSPGSGQAPEQVLHRVPVGALMLSLVMSTTMLVGVLATAFLVAITVATEGVLGLFGVLLTGGLPILAVVGELFRFYGFTVARSPDGLRLRSGLATKQAQTVPPDRVHAVEIRQPLLWRLKGWVRVSVTVAGAAGESEQGSGTLVPVAAEPTARDMVDLVLPGLALDALTWVQAPTRSRWRAPWQWRRLAISADSAVVAVRSGRFVRRTVLVPHARAQSVTLVQGPWQRRLSLATVRMDVAPGPVTAQARHLDAGTARRVLDAEAVVARRARLGSGPQRWMSGKRRASGVAQLHQPPQ